MLIALIGALVKHIAVSWWSVAKDINLSFLSPSPRHASKEDDSYELCYTLSEVTNSYLSQYVKKA